MRIRGAAVAFSAIVLLAWPQPASAAACAVPAGTPGVAAVEAEFAQAVACLINEERAARGLRQLRSARRLQAAAVRHARDMVTRQYFSHVGSDGSRVTSRVRASGYLRGWPDYELGEILAWGTGSLASPPEILGAWLASPGHRGILATPAYRDFGVAAVAGVPFASRLAGGTYAVVFARRQRS